MQLQRHRNLPIDVARRIQTDIDDLFLANVTRSFEGKAELEREQLVQRHPQRIDVGATVKPFVCAAELLGAHIPQRSRNIAGLGQTTVVGRHRQTENRQPRVAPGC